MTETLLKAALAHHQAGRLTEAKQLYGEILARAPRDVMGLHFLGVIAYQQGDARRAVELIGRAVGLRPDYADAHNNLGTALVQLGRLDEAVAAYHKALAHKADYAEAHNNLGNALKSLGRLEDAEAAYRRALAIKADYADACSNLGNVLARRGHRDEAVTWCARAVTLRPAYVTGYSNLASALMSLGRHDDARAAFDKALTLSHGGPWWNASSFDEAMAAAAAPPPGGEAAASTFKLRDTIDQIDYLMAGGLIDGSFAQMTARYEAVLAEMLASDDADAINMLTPDQTARLGAFYDRVLHYADTQPVVGDVINPALDFARIEDDYLASALSVTTFDDFLTPEALRALRGFCLESTIFFEYATTRFVAGRINSGFNCSLLYRMAEELKARLPRVLGGHALKNMWVYRHGNQGEGVGAHTDEAAVTFNFWITPNDANLEPDHGGLIVYAREQPADWDWRYYNSEKYSPEVSREIDEFLESAETITIPYGENRSVLFHSNLFHKSDRVRFADGFVNRRMNVTMLFGERDPA